MRTLMVMLVLAMFGTAMVGCRAEAEIDDEMATTVAPLQ